jgi:DnaJ like chaperone protein
MSATEIIVICFGLFVGYWVVNKLLLGSPKPGPGAMPDIDALDSSGPPSGQAWHDVLKVRPYATVEEIRAAYRSMIGQYHPDKVATLGDELKALAERKSAEINAAYRQAMQSRGLES